MKWLIVLLAVISAIFGCSYRPHQTNFVAIKQSGMAKCKSIEAFDEAFFEITKEKVNLLNAANQFSALVSHTVDCAIDHHDVAFAQYLLSDVANFMYRSLDAKYSRYGDIDVRIMLHFRRHELFAAEADFTDLESEFIDNYAFALSIDECYQQVCALHDGGQVFTFSQVINRLRANGYGDMVQHMLEKAQQKYHMCMMGDAWRLCPNHV